ncbi:PapD-like protein [Pluteus cervinus]|uniref:PapD-like protein n=1 Tax=Pluteus cervinus TaxID=181527 RepID=A0ACD3A9A7_9AGAR|nr:PapD-like protein [Pluteus cervinus]
MAVTIAVPLVDEEITFKRPFRRSRFYVMILRNDHPTPVLFKVKTNNPKGYCARPNLGWIDAGRTAVVTLTKCPMETEPPIGEICKDKYLVITAQMREEDQNVPLEDLWYRMKDKPTLESKKLPIRFISDPNSLDRDLLLYEPSKSVVFRGPRDLVVSSTLTLTNQTERYVTFKVKTTKPRVYYVNPNRALLQPGASIDILLRRELHRDVDPNEKSKFMILSTVVSPLFDIENNAMFEDLWKGYEDNERVFSHKLTIVNEEGDGPSAAVTIRDTRDDSFEDDDEDEGEGEDERTLIGSPLVSPKRGFGGGYNGQPRSPGYGRRLAAPVEWVQEEEVKQIREMPAAPVVQPKRKRSWVAWAVTKVFR